MFLAEIIAGLRSALMGGHFEVKEGHPDFLQITLFFLNAVLMLYLKLFTCLEIITMLK